MARIPEEQRQVAMDLVYDRRRKGGGGPGGEDEADMTRCRRCSRLFEGVDSASIKAERADELATLPLGERLKRRIIDGERKGLEADLDEALQQRPALEIVNECCSPG